MCLWVLLNHGVPRCAADHKRIGEPGLDSHADSSIQHLGEMSYVIGSASPRPGVDLGEDWRFDSSDTVGSALVAQGTALHLSAFPSER